MHHARLLRLLVLLAFWSPNHAWPQVDNPRPAANQRALLLTPASSGHHLYAKVGQIIQVDLKTLSTAGYEAPQVSGSSIQYSNSVLLWPVNPGGPLPIYIFEAVSPGEARIQFPRNGGAGFDVTIGVRASSTSGSNRPILDQATTAEWKQGWTNLSNSVRQTFKPSLPRLTAVEVELVVANPGPSLGSVSMTLLNAEGQPLLAADKTISVDHSDHALFLLPDGFRVFPGKSYSIEISDGSGLFGWKYVAAGYNRGEALFNDKPLVPGAQAALLFRTFGSK
ncbi:MAG TPA: hypothetical protein VKQ11_19475 [Candidatus Sulfotelmatobacter sp.]|nr:hypothetical protein [Candidatus Sulfotelmatobacter sp.]